MSTDYVRQVQSLALEKALAIGAYGESVAAYRYRVLAERATTAEHRRLFDEMAEEEQGHHVVLQKLFHELPHGDFVLSADDKALVIVGPRMIDASTAAAFEKSMGYIYESEILTGNFYAALHGGSTRDDLKSLLKEMADECFDHAQRLRDIPHMPPAGE